MMRAPVHSLLGKHVLVLGLGDTGLSVARWAERLGARPRVADTRAEPPRAADFSGEMHTGAFTEGLLDDVELVCISPGLPLDQPLVDAALARRIPVVGDIELFAWYNNGPVLAVTGTNGKTTVSALTGHLLRAAGVDCEVAGNIGPAALAALAARQDRGTLPQAWVLELSSYQLETTWSLEAHAAAMLNVTEDHLDRYAGIEEYAAAKARIFAGKGVQVLNRDDPRSAAMAQSGREVVSFGAGPAPRASDFGLRDAVLVQGDVPILARSDLPIHGLHNVANALAACALARAAGVALEDLAAGLRSFTGLPHRLQRVALRNGVEWYDDSKGTNVGATIAALRGLGRRSVLILGGEGKGQDFAPLAGPAKQFSKHVLLIGRDAPLIERALSGLALERCASLEHAVERAAALAFPGEAVLLSPACASFDMFRDYRHRGEAFTAAIKRLPQ